MLEEDIRNQVKEKLTQELGREPLKEEIDSEIGSLKDWVKRKEGKDFIVGLYRRFSNKNLQKAIEKKGIIYTELRKLTGIHPQSMSRIVNFKQKPTEKQKVKIAVALNMPIDEIFPEKYDELYDRISPLPVKAEVKIKTVALDSPEVLKLQAPDHYFRQIEKKIEFKNRIGKSLAELSPREQGVINYRFGMTDGKPHSLEETAQYFGVSRERIRQIECKAIEKIRANQRSNQNKK
jgi:RNA polymerase sigma factor (sigma-70 family)